MDAGHFGKYHVLERIARGGMAEVYKVKTVGIAGFEKIQALKRIVPDLAREPRFIRSFVDEARIAVELNHRNIVQVFDFGKAAGELYLAMELIEGIDLRTAILDAAKQHIELPIALTCYVLGEVGAGLDYAHRKTDIEGRNLGIVHCDVSPQNIMLSWEGYVKILDFGVARARFSTAPVRRLRGKPRYMAPEQTRSKKPTPETDVFALGIVAWELLTGLPLFDGDDMKSILRAVRRADAPAVEKLNPDVPAALSDAIARALSVDPAARGTSTELAAELTRAAREREAGIGPRDLADWLERVYPRLSDRGAAPAPIQRAPTAPTARVRGPVRLPTPPPVSGGITADTRAGTSPHVGDEIDEAPATAPLQEKRRVVACAAVADGGSDDARRELLEMLGHLAYKRGAVVRDEDTADDTVVAVFGLEVAGEDDVATAMGFALDAISAAREADGELAVRVGARAGAFAQRRPDGGYRLVGAAVREARDLARGAQPGRPLLAGGGGRLTSAYYAFRELPARRHLRRRLRVLELLGPRTFDERDRALLERRGRFVGRDEELARLAAALARALEDDRRVVAALTGPAGVGKSRVVAELCARAAAAPEAPDARPLLVACAATPRGRVAPFSLVTEMFQSALNLPPGRGETARGRLVQRLRANLEDGEVAREEVDDIVGAVEYAMELRDGGLQASAQPSADLRDRLAAAVRSFRAANLARGRPLITVLEDLHFCDAASAEVLRQSVESENPGPELLILTARPGAAAVPDAVDERIELGELDGDAREALVRDRLGDDATPAAVAAVAERAGGNPLFIEELADAVRERGSSEVPPSLRDVVVSRVDHLAKETKAVLQYAAVVGPTFRARILEEVIGRDVHEEIDALCDDGLLDRPAAASPEAREGELAFARGLVRDVVYDSLSARARRETHARVGRLLAARYRAGREEPPAQIADHLERGGEIAAAAAFWLRAGRVALAAYDAAGAIDLFGRTLALERQLGDTPKTRASHARRREALAGLEEAHRQLGDHEAQADDLRRLRPLVADDPARLGDVEVRTAIRLLRLGSFTAAAEATERAEACAREGGDERLRGEALRLRGEAFERQGDFEAALDAVGRARRIFRDIGAAAEETQAMIGAGRIHLVRARYETARDAYDAILERVEQTGDPWLERVVRNHVAVINLCLGNFEDAMASAQRSVEICRRYRDRARLGDNLSVCGIVLGEVGQYTAARARFEEALAILATTRSVWSRADCLVYAGNTEACLGDFDRAIAYLRESVTTANDIGAKYVEVNARAALAWVLLRRGAPGDIDEALDIAARGAEIARAATLVGPEIQCLSRQAEATWRAGDLDAALELSRAAMALLDDQRYVEGSEEELVFTHYELLREAGDAEAAAFLERARDGVRRKLADIDDPDWRASFTEQVALHALLLSDRALPTRLPPPPAGGGPGWGE